MVILLGGSEQNISMILIITKAKLVGISRGKSKGSKLYWMGNIPQIIGKKKRWVKYKNLVKQALCTSK